MGFSKGFLLTPFRSQLQFVRYKNKINITHPRLPHYERSVVESVCVPKLNKKKNLPYIPLYDECNVKAPKIIEEPHPMETILSKEILNWLNHSKLIAIFHVNFMDSDDKFEHLVLLRQNGIKVLEYNKRLIELALTGTIYEPILPFYSSHTCLGVCRDLNLHVLMSLLNKLPFLTLMAGLINNRLFDYSELTKYGALKNIEEARMKLVGTLSMAPQNLVNQLNYHPNKLMQSLNQIKEQTTEGK